VGINMRENKIFTIFIVLISLFLISFYIQEGFCLKIEREEAIAIADLWYAMEVNSPHVKIHKSDKKERLKRIQNRKVLYLISKDDLRETISPREDILAYVVKYDPSGFVVVSADDRIEPVIVFDALSEFRWDEPEHNFLRYFLGKEIPKRMECINEKEVKGEKVEVHPKWKKLRLKLKKVKTLEEASYQNADGEPSLDGGGTYVFWETPLWGQKSYYNDTVQKYNGGYDCPTGCVATSMAIKMRFHEWPPSGSGSHEYDDTSGSIQYHHYVNYASSTYNWTNMPISDLKAPNNDVADLMYHCGVSVDMDYELDGSGAYLSDVASVLNDYFRYRRSTVKFSSHENPAKESILGGLPVNMGGHGHAVVATGYRDEVSPYFYINTGWSGYCNGWYNLSDFPNNPNNCSTDAIELSIPYSTPGNYFYVDGHERRQPDGSILEPYEYISQGVSAVPSGGTLWIKGGNYTKRANTYGNYDVPITINKIMTIRSYEGVATIGP